MALGGRVRHTRVLSRARGKSRPWLLGSRRNHGSPRRGASLFTDIVAETRVVDDFTFEVTLKEPAGWFMAAVVYTPTAAIVGQDAVEKNADLFADPHQLMMTYFHRRVGPNARVQRRI
jgi:ABC-type transport system substrate-binding protein